MEPDDQLWTQIAVKLGYLAPGQVAAALAPEPGANPGSSLPARLVARGWLTSRQAEEVTDRARARAYESTSPPARTGPPAGADPAPVEPETLPTLRAAACDATVQGIDADPGRSDAAAARGPQERTFGRYRLLHELGRGGMGVVYKAYHPGLKSYFAVKVLLAGRDAPVEEVERFHREAEALARLRHPGIVAVHDIGTEDGKTYFAMDYVEGLRLDRILDDPAAAGMAAVAVHPSGSAAARRQALPPATALRLIQEVAEALQAAHEAGVLHRDLKPANVIRDREGRLKIMDFGLAKLTGVGGKGVTRTGAVMGTPAYMSPEQAEGRTHDLDARSDVYQLGAMLYELMTGRPPHEGDSTLATVLHVLLHEPPPPRRANPGLSADAETICLTALAREPVRRYASARELADDCRRFLAGEAIRARRAGWWELPLRRLRRHKAAAAVLFLACAALSGGGYVSWRNWDVAARARRDQERQQAEARRERARLEHDVLAGLRAIADTSLRAALRLRRAGVRTSEVERDFLPPLQEAVARAVAQAPALAEPHWHLGRMQRALLRFGAARAEQDLALRAEPDYAPSLYERVILEAKSLGDRVAALRRHWAMAEGLRLADAGQLAPGGLGGAVQRTCPPDDVLVAGDTPARRLRDTLVSDVKHLENLVSRTPVGRPEPAAPAATALWPGGPAGPSRARLTCAQGLGLLANADPAAQGKGEALLAQALGEEPDLEEAYEELAQRELGRSAYGRAVEIFSQGLAVDRGYVPFWSGRATVRILWGNDSTRRGEDPEPRYRDAVADLTQALDLDPGNTEAWTHRGVLHQNWGAYAADHGQDPGEQFGAAVADLDRALALDPVLAMAWLTRGLTRSAWGNDKAARGEDPEPWYRQAAADLARATELDPGELQAWKARGGLNGSWGNFQMARGLDPRACYARAATDFGESLKLDPGQAAVWRHRGTTHMNTGLYLSAHGEDPRAEYAGAAADFDHAIALDPADAQAWLARALLGANWGPARSEHGEDPSPTYERGEQDHARALELNPACFEAWVSRGNLRMNWGLFRARTGADPEVLYARSVADFTKAAQLCAARPEGWGGRAKVRIDWALYLGERGKDPGALYAAAEADLAQAQELIPADPESWANRGTMRMNWALYASDHGGAAEHLYSGSVADFTKALELNPANADLWDSRGCVHMNRAAFEQGRGGDPEPHYALALHDLDKAVELNPGLATAWAVRAGVRLNRCGHRSDPDADPAPEYTIALADFERALALSPENADTWRGRGLLRRNWGNYLLLHQGDPEALYAGSATDYGKALTLEPGRVENWMGRAELYRSWGLYRQSRGGDPVPEWTRARSDSEEVLKLNPRAADAWLGLGRTHALWGEREKVLGGDFVSPLGRALWAYDRALAVHPGLVEALWRRGLVHHAVARWADALADLEAAARLDPGSRSSFSRELAEVQTQVKGPAQPPSDSAWQVEFHRAAAALETSDYPAAGTLYEDGLAGLQASLAAVPEAGRARILADPGLRQMLTNVHYNLACVLALASAGREGPKAAPRAIAADTAGRLRDQAFEHLEQTFGLGWNDREHLAADPDLEPLHADPRWARLLAGGPK